MENQSTKNGISVNWWVRIRCSHSRQELCERYVCQGSRRIVTTVTLNIEMKENLLLSERQKWHQGCTFQAVTRITLSSSSMMPSRQQWFRGHGRCYWSVYCKDVRYVKAIHQPGRLTSSSAPLFCRKDGKNFITAEKYYKSDGSSSIDKNCRTPVVLARTALSHQNIHLFHSFEFISITADELMMDFHRSDTDNFYFVENFSLC